MDEVIGQINHTFEKVADVVKHGIKIIQRFIVLTRSNNWLKIHGYPMRRSNNEKF